GTPKLGDSRLDGSGIRVTVETLQSMPQGACSHRRLSLVVGNLGLSRLFTRIAHAVESRCGTATAHGEIHVAIGMNDQIGHGHRCGRYKRLELTRVGGSL